jgi:hypothetical protein
MKKFFIFSVLAILMASSYTQEGDDWINRISYNTTEECIDSIQCYTEVFVKVNMSVVLDSASICIKIGSTYGTDDIYGQCFLNAPSLKTEVGVASDQQGDITINTGKYIIGEEFFVDMTIKE